MKKKAFLSYSFALIAVFSFGCASTRSFKVDAIAISQPVTSRTYHIVSANPSVPDNDLRFIESAQIVEKALATRGYTRRAESDSADLVIALESSVGQPENITESHPQPAPPDFGFYHSVRVPVRSRHGGVCYVRTMVWAPDYPYWDANNVTTTTYYEKRLALTAFANNGASDLPQVWSVVVTERDPSSDIRALLPMMAVSASKYVEADTRGQVNLTLETKDPDVVRIAPARVEAKTGN